jgi:tRNA threonylcarbamoyladenosine biosynthesis protein TsaE
MEDTRLKWQTEAVNAEMSELLGKRLGEQLKGGEVIELLSDLGGGKTTLVRGLARGIGSSDHVSSPTFTLSNVYQAPRCTIYHFDFYRLHEPGLIVHELNEALQDPQAVVVIEWGAIVQDVLPPERLTISLDRTGEETRTITVHYPPKLASVVKALQ